MIYSLTIPGPPVAKERPRKGRYGNFYTPPRTQEFEQRIHLAFVSRYGNIILQNPLSVEIVFYLHTRGRSDIDNQIKSCLDGFKHIFNDRLVYKLSAEIKINPQEKDRIEIKITEFVKS